MKASGGERAEALPLAVMRILGDEALHYFELEGL
jgi:hypothetical protein